MKDPTIDKLIDLPAPPLRTTVAEGPLSDAQVIVHLLNGESMPGKLQYLSVAQATIGIQHASTKETTRIAFSKFRYLEFTRKLSIAADEHPVLNLSKEVQLPPTLQTFQVLFMDGKSIKGKTRGVFVDQSGLHVFKPLNKYSVARLFFPAVAVKNYRIGPLLGDVLIRDGSSRHQDIAAAMSKQASLRGKKIGEYLVANKVVNADQLQQALDRQANCIDQVEDPQHNKKIGQLLVEDGLISPSQLELALQEQASDHNKKLGRLLEEMGVVSDEDVHRVLAHKLSIPFVGLRNFDIDSEALALVPRDIALKYLLIPLYLHHERLVIAMDDPSSPEAIDVVQFITNRHLELVAATREDIKIAIRENYDEELMDEDIIAAECARSDTNLNSDQEEELRAVERLGKEKPIVRLVSKIILDAIHRRASDIHLRPRENSVDLFFRIDGTLIKTRSFSKGLLAAVISRIKIIGIMDIAERRLPQDGRARISDKATVVDLRISVIPTVNGESAVIRLLNTANGLKSVSQLGFNSHDGETITDLLHKSYGLILVTGPTGSGKSTTLYAALQDVIAQNVNIITVEDPVEYHIDSIEQIQINTATGYTFARALRHILRHDPDVIMIGEIRDQETGKIAVESALTGHLVLSTLHTNDAAGAITRLLEMGIDPFLLNATLLGIVAQRLVRCNCAHCSQEEVPDPFIRKSLGITGDEVFFKGRGCEHCNDTGFSGRIAVYELLRLTSDMHTLIHNGVAVDAVHAQAIKDGMVPLTENALTQARQRTISLAEVYRIRLE